jgi:fluoride ion exporter CrcB/FEX
METKNAKLEARSSFRSSRVCFARSGHPRRVCMVGRLGLGRLVAALVGRLVVVEHPIPGYEATRETKKSFLIVGVCGAYCLFCTLSHKTRLLIY